LTLLGKEAIKKSQRTREIVKEEEEAMQKLTVTFELSYVF